MDALDVGLSIVGRVARVGGTSGWFAGYRFTSWEQDVRVKEADERAGPFVVGHPSCDQPLARARTTARPLLATPVASFGLSRTPSIHGPGANIKITYPTRVTARMPGSSFSYGRFFLSRLPGRPAHAQRPCPGGRLIPLSQHISPPAPYSVMQCLSIIANPPSS
ncbi:hypothetical protein FKP32DRAFT_1597990 [Trametes sanguinea]|nr:hypothetical protein FKP32DRAFT_1597990 [Trametes sanguinea]